MFVINVVNKLELKNFKELLEIQKKTLYGVNLNFMDTAGRVEDRQTSRFAI